MLTQCEEKKLQDVNSKFWEKKDIISETQFFFLRIVSLSIVYFSELWKKSKLWDKKSQLSIFIFIFSMVEMGFHR